MNNEVNESVQRSEERDIHDCREEEKNSHYHGELHDQSDPYGYNQSKKDGVKSGKSTFLLLLICCILLAVITIRMLIPASRLKTDKWEYRTETLPSLDLSDIGSKVISIDSSSLTSMGNSGWELCAALPLTETKFPNFGNEEYHTGIKTNTRTGQVILIFKRRM